MDSKTSLDILHKVRAEREKAAAPDTAAFADQVQNAASTQLQTDAMGDVRNMLLASLGVGLAGRGAAGLFNLVTKSRAKKRSAGPTVLAMPYPAMASDKIGSWLGGGDASSKMGIPWYAPAMLMTGLAGVGAGWKGLDLILENRRKAEREKELGTARQEFQNALLAQYDKPVNMHSSLIPGHKKAAAAPDAMSEVGAALDRVWEKFGAALETVTTKEAIDWSNLAGSTAGAYGAYAGLTGLLSGAFIYDKIKKRSRQAVLEKAMQRRRRREFMQRPTEIVAVPEPRLHEPEPAAETALMPGAG